MVHERRVEARVGAQLIQALQAQVEHLTCRESTRDEALLAQRRENEQLSQERADRRAQAEASENALRDLFRALSARVEAQVDQGEKSLRDYASQLRAQADASEGVLRQEIARLRSEAAVSLSAASPNSNRPPTVAELGLRVEALKQLKESGVPAFPAKELGYTLMELRLAGYSFAEVRLIPGYSLAEIKAVGYVEGLKAAGIKCDEAKTAGFTLEEMRAGGYTCAEAKTAGFTLTDLRTGGYTCADAKAAGFVEGLMAAGFTCAEG